MVCCSTFGGGGRGTAVRVVLWTKGTTCVVCSEHNEEGGFFVLFLFFARPWCLNY